MSQTVLSLLVLKSPTINKLRAFYAILGIAFAEEQHGKGPVHYSGTIGDTVLEIYPLTTEGSVVDTTTRLGFRVDSLDSVVSVLRTQGVTIVSEPQATEFGHRAIVRDPDGRTVELYQR